MRALRARLGAEDLLCRSFLRAAGIVPSRPRWVSQETVQRTSSDHALNFVSAGVRAGLDVSLHSGFIDEQEIHRLARIQIGTRRYFADVGSGWPAIKR